METLLADIHTPTDPTTDCPSVGSTIMPSVDIGVDYLMGIAHFSRLQLLSFVNYCKQIYHVEFEEIEINKRHGCYTFTNSYQSPINGLKIFWLRKKGFAGGDYPYTVSLVVPGSAVRQLSFRQVSEFICRCTYAYRCKFTRVDLRLDDYRKRVSFMHLFELAAAGDIAGVQKYIFIRSGVMGDRGQSESDSIYLGSKRRCLNVYNAELLHNIPAYRWEGRFREDRAETITNYIANSIEDFTDLTDILTSLLQYCGNKILSIAKFISRNGDTKQSLDRYNRHEFYASFYDDVGEIDSSLLKSEPQPKYSTEQMLTRTFDTIKRQYAKRFAVLRESFGVGTLYQLFENHIDDALYNRFNTSDRIKLRDLQEFVTQVTIDGKLQGVVNDLLPA